MGVWRIWYTDDQLYNFFLNARAGAKEQGTTRAAHTPSASILPMPTANNWKRWPKFHRLYTFWSQVICNRIHVTFKLLRLIQVHVCTSTAQSMMITVSLGRQHSHSHCPNKPRDFTSLGCPGPLEQQPWPWTDTTLCSDSFHNCTSSLNKFPIPKPSFTVFQSHHLWRQLLPNRLRDMFDS